MSLGFWNAVMLGWSLGFGACFFIMDRKCARLADALREQRAACEAVARVSASRRTQ